MEWLPTTFDKELAKVLKSKSSISLSLTDSLKSMALEHAEHCDYITKSVIQFIQHVPLDYRHFGLYIIHAITKSAREQSQMVYIDRFSTLLKDHALTGLFEDCSGRNKAKVQKLLAIWKKEGLFEDVLLDDLKYTLFGNSNDANQGPPDSTNTLLYPPAVNTSTLLDSLDSLNSLIPLDSQTVGSLDSNSFVTGRQEQTNSLPSTTPPAPHESDIISSYRNHINYIHSIPSILDGPSSGNIVEVLNELMNKDGTNTQVIGITEPHPPPLPPQMSGPTQHLPNNQCINPPVPLFNYNPSFIQKQQHQRIDDSPHYLAVTPQLPPLGISHSVMPNRPPPPTHHGILQRIPQETQNPLPQAQSRRINAMIPTYDRTLEPGSIRVLTRSLFVGPLPYDCEAEEVEHIFSRYGDIISVILRKKNNRHNAFLKYSTHQATRAAKYNSANLEIHHRKVNVNWAYGFGPKRFFDYERGESIIPLADLTDDERRSLTTTTLGGFRGGLLQDRMAVEEPEVPYKPEWQKDTHYHHRQRKNDSNTIEEPSASFHNKRHRSIQDAPRKKSRWHD
ncbi:hypothetical protein BCR42DRAFT_408642 [Absidia repens]|uniref:Uncharacterized protein n=1 Tax=Absidia repens TaxID=90262 RepID=A0A1X2IQ19_9FUNG|nr:hypothetical protein BCR42DRAFT_408642 [Absidia repens]